MKNSGFTYVGLMVTIAVMGVLVAAVGPSWRTLAKVEREKELIWRGHQFRRAIGLYYNKAILHGIPANSPSLYPQSLDDLLKDPMSAAGYRFLRKKYTDPMTGKFDWVTIQGQGGRIIGVHSNSDAEPLKKDGFDLDDASFKGKTRYSEWQFMYVPQTQQQK